MFQDEKEELKRIEQALLEQADGEPQEDDCEEEDLFEEEDPIEELYRPRNVCVYNSDKSDPELDDYAQQVLEGRRDGVSGLVVTALLLSVGIVGVMAWILLRYWV